MRFILEAVLPPFGIIAVGYLLRRIRRTDPEPLAEVAMMVAAPCLAFSALTHAEIQGEEVWKIALSAGGVVLVSGLLGLGVLRAARLPARGLILPIMFMNAANLPFPITKFLWGAEGLGRAVIFYIVVSILVFTLGIAIASGRAGWRKVLAEPMVWAAVAALAVRGIHIEVPVVMDRGVQLVGDAAIPIILLLLGMQLERTRIGSLPAAALAASLRLGGGLILGLAIASLVGLDGRAWDVVVLCSAMPPAMINAAIALRYNADPQRVAAAVLLGTLISLISLPLVIRYVL